MTGLYSNKKAMHKIYKVDLSSNMLQDCQVKLHTAENDHTSEKK